MEFDTTTPLEIAPRRWWREHSYSVSAPRGSVCMECVMTDGMEFSNESNRFDRCESRRREQR
jgi:hypothetical protein